MWDFVSDSVHKQASSTFRAAASSSPRRNRPAVARFASSKQPSREKSPALPPSRACALLQGGAKSCANTGARPARRHYCTDECAEERGKGQVLLLAGTLR